MPQPPDYYLILGIPPTATTDQIKRAYRARALAAHPDRGGSQRDMQLINEAWTTLGDPDSRRNYDLSRSAPPIQTQPIRTPPKQPPQQQPLDDSPEPTFITEIGKVLAAIAFHIGRAISSLARLLSGKSKT